MPLGGEGVVFAWRPRLAFLPFVFEDSVFLETGEQGIEGTLHDYHVGLTELFDDVVGITCALFQQEHYAVFEETFTHLCPGVVCIHVCVSSVCCDAKICKSIIPCFA